MKDSIYTIPISEVFKPKRGCPLCALHATLEERWVDYITGAAMMEPDVRVQTNKHGFCGRHFDMMLATRNRLSVALILQTRLAWIDENLDTVTGKAPGIFRKEGGPQPEECFVCMKINGEFIRINSNIAIVWAREPEFRELYAGQEALCFPHTQMLLAAGRASLKKEKLTAFIQATNDLTRKPLRTIKSDIDAFCNLYDYRNPGTATEDVATSIERAIAYLTGIDFS